MPRKERPSPLSDAIFRAKLEKKQLPSPIGTRAPDVPEEIPVHNTFIQFGAPKGLELDKQQMSTAPAWIGPSFQSMIQSAMQPVQPDLPLLADGGQASDDKDWDCLSSPKELASPKKVPVMRYSLSASSARAAGVPTANAVVASYEPLGGWPECTPSKATEAFAVWPPGQDPSTTQAGDDDVAEDDDAESREGLAIPLDELPSVGSAKHAEGQCKRCCFFPKGRCQNGHACEFCHFDHEKRKRKKKKKKKNAEQKDDSDSEAGSDSEGGEAAAAAEGGDAATPPVERRRGGSGASRAAAQGETPAAGSASTPPPLGSLGGAAGGGGGAFGEDSPAEVWSSTPPSAHGSVGTLAGTLSLESPLHQRSQLGSSLVGQPMLPPLGERASPSNAGDCSLGESGAQPGPSGQAWPRSVYEVDPYYAYAAAQAGSMDGYGIAGYGRGMLGAAAAAIGGQEPRLPMYSPYAGMPGYAAGGLPPQAGAGSPWGAAAPGFGGRPAPR